MPTPTGVPVAMMFARVQRNAGRERGNQSGNVKNQLTGARILAQLAIDPALNRQVLSVDGVS